MQWKQVCMEAVGVSGLAMSRWNGWVCFRTISLSLLCGLHQLTLKALEPRRLLCAPSYRWYCGATTCLIGP